MEPPFPLLKAGLIRGISRFIPLSINSSAMNMVMYGKSLVTLLLNRNGMVFLLSVIVIISGNVPRPKSIINRDPSVAEPETDAEARAA